MERVRPCGPCRTGQPGAVAAAATWGTGQRAASSAGATGAGATGAGASAAAPWGKGQRAAEESAGEGADGRAAMAEELVHARRRDLLHQQGIQGLVVGEEADVQPVALVAGARVRDLVQRHLDHRLGAHAISFAAATVTRSATALRGTR